MESMTEENSLGDMLIEEQIITDEQLSDALEKKKGTTKRLGEVLVELGYTSETDIAKALSSQLGLEIVSLSGIQIEENVLKLVDVAVLRKYVMVPIGFSPNNMNEVRVAMADPMDMRGIDDFSIITNLQVAPVIATNPMILCLPLTASMEAVKQGRWLRHMHWSAGRKSRGNRRRRMMKILQIPRLSFW